MVVDDAAANRVRDEQEPPNRGAGLILVALTLSCLSSGPWPTHAAPPPTIRPTLGSDNPQARPAPRPSLKALPPAAAPPPSIEPKPAPPVQKGDGKR